MMWQDLVFMLGSGLSIVFLAPTLRDATANVPLGTSLPSMGIGFVYGLTFLSLGMAFSAAGAIAAGSMWALIALVRSPQGLSGRLARVESPALFAHDLQRWLARRRSSGLVVEQYVAVDPSRYGTAD
ncbi:hypothetical protein ACFO5R_01900 [Halosolutus amylolyticus]|uniref:Uncharacterized protein n=1 Tax=Halosolutus amylolyticus TaxID=2932267 RepID=A0ABD5PJT7_9EURY|nr:hypothetical protein [Halosolutus amylolyticus]